MDSFSFHETKQHGSAEFPFAYFFVDQHHPRYVMPYHWHKEWEIIHVTEGEFCVTLDDAVYTAHAGDILLVRDGMLHSGIPESCSYECFLFDLHRFFQFSEAAKKHLRPIYRKQILPTIHYPHGSLTELEEVVCGLSETCKKNDVSEGGTPFELLVLSFISRFFAVILQEKQYDPNPNFSAQNVLKIDLIKNVLSYIEENYASLITLDHLAKVSHMNPRYFCRFFQSIMHVSPMAYVAIFRVEKAADLLQNTSLSVLHICMECGFNDCSHFIKVFKKHKGLTPNQYRRLQR